MREPVPVGGTALDEYRGAHRRVHEIEQRVFVDVGQRREQADVELAADDRRETQDAQRFVTEPLDPSSHDVADAGRQAELVEIVGDGPAAVVAEHDPARLPEMAQELGGEERIAVGLAAQRVREPDTGVVELVTGGRRHQLDQLVVFEAGERDPA